MGSVAHGDTVFFFKVMLLQVTLLSPDEGSGNRQHQQHTTHKPRR